jgi:hypothetical protein
VFWSVLIWYKVYGKFGKNGAIGSKFEGRKTRSHGDVTRLQLKYNRKRKHMTKTLASLRRREGETGK